MSRDRGLAIRRQVTRAALALLSAVLVLMALSIGRFGVAAAEGSPFRRGVNIADYLAVVWFPPSVRQEPHAFWYAPDNATIDGDLARVQRLGFGFVRVVVDAAALAPLEGAERTAAIATIDRVLQRVPAAGLGLVVALAFPEGAADQRRRIRGDALLAGTEEGLRPLLRVVRDIGQVVARLPAERVAFAPLAEPPVCARDAPRWFAVQEQALAALRDAGFKGWSVVSPPCYGTLGAFLSFDPRSLMTEHTLVTFHFYEPYGFTHQGHSGFAPQMPYLDGVPFPFDAAAVSAALQRARERLSADTALSAEQRDQRWSALRTEMDAYRATGPDQRFVQGRIAAAAAYARALDIPADRILVGEFGVSVGRPPARRGAEEAHRAAYVGAVREAIEAAGFGWAVWELWGGFGLVATRAERCVAPAILAALGLRDECAATRPR